ncbi:phage/plasmid primase, P4 family [Anaerotignum sp.]|uniref:phage/plasmid primase, P4 family n=1 Tax=Anaerotignum sp. TaxID=2039241 RepID=UPI003332EEDF
MNKIEISEILERFSGAKKIGADRWQVKCPVHDDKQASLTISKEKGKILFHCHAGCETENILQAAGLSWADIGEGKTPQTWKEKLEAWKGKPIEAVYNYNDAKEKYLYSKVRFAGKEIIFGKINEDHSFFNTGIGETPRVLYNLNSVIKAVNGGYPVYYCEGEKDCDTLREMGFAATTAGSVSDWKPEFAKFFIGARVIILPDNDEPGFKLKDEVLRDLKNYAHATKAVITSQAEKGDITDYIKEGYTKADFQELVKETEWKYAPWIQAGKNGLRVNEGILAKSVEQSMEYIILRKAGVEVDKFCLYVDGVYKECRRPEIKAYIRKYLPDSLVKDAILNNVYNLLLSSEGKVKTFEAVNSNERYINLKNGILDTIGFKLIPHSPKNLSTIQLNCNFNENAPEPKHWLKYINDLCTVCGVVDHERVAVLQEWVGLILSNYSVYRVKQSLCLYSSLGNTGKSIFPKPLIAILGAENTNNVPMQNLSDRFALADIYGRRLIVTGDQKGNDIEDSSTYKELTGGDYVRCEMKGKGGFNFLFTGGIVSICNDLPSFKGDKGTHLFERFNLIKCTNVIPHEKRDKTLEMKILNELDGVFMWGLEGLKRLLKNQFCFTQCKANEEAISEWRAVQDTFYSFLIENCELTGDTKSDRIKKTELEKAYRDWCEDKEIEGLNSKNIQARAEKNGIECGVYYGYQYYKGVQYRFDSKYFKPPAMAQVGLKTAN